MHAPKLGTQTRRSLRKEGPRTSPLRPVEREYEKQIEPMGLELFAQCRRSLRLAGLHRPIQHYVPASDEVERPHRELSRELVPHAVASLACSLSYKNSA